MATHRPFVQPEVEQVMNGIASAIADVVPKGFGFTLLMYEMNTPTGFMNYISNGEREDVIAALKELLANFEGRGHEPPRSKQ